MIRALRAMSCASNSTTCEVDAVPRSVPEIFASILSAAWRRRYLIVVPIIVLPPLAIVSSFVVPKAYEARMKILVQEPAKNSPFLNDFAIGPDLKERMPALRTLLHSEHVLGEILDKQRGGAVTDKKMREALLRDLSSALHVELVGSDLVELKIRRPWAAGLADTLRAVGQQFIERMIAPGRSAVASSEKFLESQMVERRDGVAAAERALSDFKRANADRLPSIYGANVQRLVTLKQKLEEKTLELKSMHASFEDLRTRLVSTNPIIGRLEEGIIQLTGELNALRARYTNSHSEVQSVERKLARLQEERRNLVESMRSVDDPDLSRLWNMAARVDGPNDRPSGGLLVSQLQKLQDSRAQSVALGEEVEQLTRSIGELQTHIAKFGPIEQEMQRLERQVTAAREMQENLSKRYEMARIALALGHFESPERVRIVETPTDPVSPVTPGRMIFLLAGIIAGVGLGAALAAVAEIFDPIVRTAAEIEAIIGVPVLIRVPNMQTYPT
jgi:polysaccharide chain length determinant protein (PEP-CTERM system associated)